MAFALKPPRRAPTGNGSAIFSKPKLIWPPCSKLFPTTNRCAQPSPRAADCACCARSRGNVSRRSSCPRPSKSSKSGKSSPCFANDSGNPSSGRRMPGSAGVPPASNLTMNQAIRRRDASAPKTLPPHQVGKGPCPLQTKAFCFTRFPRRNASPQRLNPNCAPARWAFARQIFLRLRGKSPAGILIWKCCGNFHIPKRARN